MTAAIPFTGNGGDCLLVDGVVDSLEGRPVRTVASVGVNRVSRDCMDVPVANRATGRTRIDPRFLRHDDMGSLVAATLGLAGSLNTGNARV